MASADSSRFFRKRIASGAILAPMAGYSDAPFRKLCREHGSAYAVTEMVSAKALVLGHQQGIEIGAPYPGEPDLVIQLFASDPVLAAAAARMVFEKYHPAALDLNMGCPVKKVVNKGCGSDLMRNLDTAKAIVRELVAAVPVPVSAKMRLGFDRINVVEAARAVAEGGAAAVAIHGRTAAQRYGGSADWDEIARVAEQLDVPVIGSGDVASREAFLDRRRKGLGVMIARASLGRPWIFSEVLGAAPPDLRSVARTAYRHACLNRDWYGEARGIRNLRGQLARYFAPFPSGQAIRPDLVRVSTVVELRGLLRQKLGLDPVDPVKTFKRQGNSGIPIPT